MHVWRSVLNLPAFVYQFNKLPLGQSPRNFASLKPGGWVENHEINFHLQSHGRAVPGYLGKWSCYLQSALEIRGTTSRCNPDLIRKQMESVGVV